MESDSKYPASPGAVNKQFDFLALKVSDRLRYYIMWAHLRRVYHATRDVNPGNCRVFPNGVRQRNFLSRARRGTLSI